MTPCRSYPLRWLPWSVALTLSCLAGGCATEAGTAEGGAAGASSTEPQEPVVLMPLTALLVNDASQTDPSGHAPNAPDCNPLSGWYAEDGGLEISTAFCDYFSGVEGAAVSADAGDVLLFDVTHYDLTSPTPAEAHISLSHGETVLLDMQVAIPGPADVLHREVVLKEGIQAGAPITLHVHNHGQNTWIFEPVRVQRQ